MEKNGYLALTFESTHAAMAAQKFLKDKLYHVVMPVPRCISASCGIAVRLEESEREDLLALLREDFPVDAGSYALYRIDAQDRAERLSVA